MGALPPGDLGLRVEGDADARRVELAHKLAVGQHVGLGPDQPPAGAYDLRLGAQPSDLLRVHRSDEAGVDVDRGDRALLDLLIGEDCRRRRGHRGIRERSGHTALYYPEWIAEVLARGHLIDRLPTR